MGCGQNVSRKISQMFQVSQFYKIFQKYPIYSISEISHLVGGRQAGKCEGGINLKKEGDTSVLSQFVIQRCFEGPQKSKYFKMSKI